MNAWRKITHVVIFIAVFAAIVAVVMLLWNALIPSITGWTTINYRQAAGLMVLTRLLFGGPWHHFGFMGNRNVNWRKEHRRFHERMGHVSLEEKKAFIRRWMNGFNEEKE